MTAKWKNRIHSYFAVSAVLFALSLTTILAANSVGTIWSRYEQLSSKQENITALESRRGELLQDLALSMNLLGGTDAPLPDIKRGFIEDLKLMKREFSDHGFTTNINSVQHVGPFIEATIIIHGESTTMLEILSKLNVSHLKIESLFVHRSDPKSAKTISDLTITFATYVGIPSDSDV